MRGVRRVYVAFGYAEDMSNAMGVSASWLANAANNGGKMKGLHVYGFDTDRSLELDEDSLAIRAVDSLSDETRTRLRALFKEV